MSRVNKLYETLDALVEEYQALLLRELEKEEASSYLHKCRDDEHIGRAYWIFGKASGLEEANEMLAMEKQIRQLCEKLGEPPPLPIVVLEEYVDEYRSLKVRKNREYSKTENFDGEHQNLKRRLIKKLLGGAEPQK
jgi:hypothetical protein